MASLLETSQYQSCGCCSHRRRLLLRHPHFFLVVAFARSSKRNARRASSASFLFDSNSFCASRCACLRSSFSAALHSIPLFTAFMLRTNLQFMFPSIFSFFERRVFLMPLR